jgi:hypothetical protein
MSDKKMNDPLATFHLGPTTEGRHFGLTPSMQNLKALPKDVNVPDFVKEAVARLDTPEQARLLLKMLRTFGPLGMRMTKEKLNELVTKILAKDTSELPGTVIEALTDGELEESNEASK